MKLYRECGGTSLTYGQTEILEVLNYPVPGQSMTIKMGRVSVTDNSPVCNSAGPKISCATATLPDLGTVSEYLYTSDSANPTGITLSGVPPPQGWIFSYKSPVVSGVTWKRNPSANIQGSDLLTWTLRAVMYPYKGKNANPCYDNSPTFAEKPSTVICTGYPFTYNPNAYDNELDSLVYDWGQPLDGNMNPITSYFTGYSYKIPLPGPVFDARNIAAKISLHTGEISFESFTSGAFVTVSKASAYKNKVLVAEIYREMQIVLLDCGNNKPPDVTPPFTNKKTGLPTFIDTVYAGQVVKFNLSATDVNTQTMTMRASGADFDPVSIGSAIPCLTPPCATLNPVVPISSTGSVSTAFNWQTTCDHLAHPLKGGTGNPNLIYNQANQSNVHNFVISVQDDYCSVPGKNVSTITVVVLNLPQLPPPSLRCISVDNATGNNQLTWISPTDTSNSFNRYYIYYSLNPGGPFILLDSILNHNQTTYTHAGADGNKHPVYYYMKTRSACHAAYLSIPGDTLSSMFLSLGTSNSIANLTWNALRNPPLPTSSGQYKIRLEYPAGRWSQINSTPKLSYNDTTKVCSALLNYKIEISDSSGCTSNSSIAGKIFKDNTSPERPQIDSVSIDSITKKAIITWKVNPSKDTKKYIVYEFVNGAWVPIDTVYGINNTFTKNLNDILNPYKGSEQYQVAAEDSCKQLSPMSIPHNTLFLSVAPDICNNLIRLTWNPYINMKNLAGYNVFMSKNNSPTFTLLATLSKNDINYIHNTLDKNSNYCYYIRAFDNTGKRTSTSNIVCASAKTMNKPQFIYLRYATVNLDNPNRQVVDLRWYSDSTVKITKFIVLKSDSVNFPYLPIATIFPSGLSDEFYTDFDVSPDQQSYSYKIEAYDSCGNLALTSNIGKTIFLTGSANIDMKNTIVWNPYEQWDVPINNYNIYRSIGNKQSFIFAKSLSPVLPYNTFIDDVSGNALNAGEFYYRVEAEEGTGQQFNFHDKSLSNIVEVIQNPRYFIPNAFYPDGMNMNSVFTPIGIFFNGKDFYFGIYNRLGVRVFESTTSDLGWDGKIKGAPASMGVYVYILKYSDSEGNRIIKKGTVTLLR